MGSWPKGSCASHEQCGASTTWGRMYPEIRGTSDPLTASSKDPQVLQKSLQFMVLTREVPAGLAKM